MLGSGPGDAGTESWCRRLLEDSAFLVDLVLGAGLCVDLRLPVDLPWFSSVAMSSSAWKLTDLGVFGDLSRFRGGMAGKEERSFESWSTYDIKIGFIHFDRKTDKLLWDMELTKYDLSQKTMSRFTFHWPQQQNEFKKSYLIHIRSFLIWVNV